MRLLRNVGIDTYRGWDRGENKRLEILPGEIVGVSSDEAEALLDDFPGRFEELGQCVDTAAPTEAANVVSADRFTNETKPARPRRTKKT